MIDVWSYKINDFYFFFAINEKNCIRTDQAISEKNNLIIT